MRIAIVNDVHIAVSALKKAVLSMSGCQVAWIARDGKEAVAQCRADTPDLILMDLIMPVMDGVEATRRIMNECPCAILVVTASVDGNASRVFDAMGAGALDATFTPLFQKDGTLKGAEELVAKIRSVSRLISPEKEMPRNILMESKGEWPVFIAVGVSTGGPATLVSLLNGFSTALPAAIVIVQHIDARFSRRLTSWLNELVAWPVEPAEQGERVKPGHAYLAVEEAHLVVDSRGYFQYRNEPTDTPYRPSVDEFFFSLSRSSLSPGYGVLLTGMGTDGAKGLLALKNAGWTTYAQDEESSVIYGMPRAAAHLGAADYIESLTDIPPSISNRIQTVR